MSRSMPHLMAKMEQAILGSEPVSDQIDEYDHRIQPLKWTSSRGFPLKEAHKVLSIETELRDSLLEKLRNRGFARCDPTYLNLPNFQVFSYREYPGGSPKCGHFAFHCIVFDQIDLSAQMLSIQNQFKSVLPALETCIYANSSTDATFHSYGLWSLYVHVATLTGAEYVLKDGPINVLNFVNADISADKATLKQHLAL